MFSWLGIEDKIRCGRIRALLCREVSCLFRFSSLLLSEPISRNIKPLTAKEERSPMSFAATHLRDPVHAETILELEVGIIQMDHITGNPLWGV